MTTPSPAHSSLDWEEHPVIVAAGSVAAALLFAWDFVVPLKTAELESEISAGKKQIATLKDEAAPSDAVQRGRIDELSKRRRAIDSRLNEAVSRLWQHEIEDTYVSGDPYPVGISAVKRGNDFDAIDRAFPDATKRRTGGSILAVEIDYAVIPQITLLRGEVRTEPVGLRPDRVDLKNEDLRPALDLKLNAAFGSPREMLDGNEAWNVGGTSVVHLKDAVSVSPPGTRPGSSTEDRVDVRPRPRREPTRGSRGT